MTRRHTLSLLVALGVALSGRAAADTGVVRGHSFVPTTGYVDPTVATFNGNKPLVACSSSCATALVNQNTDALQAALDAAATAPHPWVHLPPGDYPMARGKGLGGAYNAITGVKIDGKTGVVVVGYGATLRETGAITGTYEMFQIRNSSNIRLYGLTFSQRDDSTSPPAEQNHMLQLGDGGNTGAVDNVQIVDCHFTEGKGGDAVRLLGGTTQANVVQRVAIADNVINGKRSCVGLQHGVALINVTNNFMGPDDTDQMIDHEPTSGGGNNYENFFDNHLERPATRSGPDVSLGGDNSSDQINQTAHSTALVRNSMPNGEISGLSLWETWLVDNYVADQSLVGKPILYIFRRVENFWAIGNHLEQRTSDATGSTFSVQFGSDTGFRPIGVWFAENTLDIYGAGSSSTAAALFGSKDTWVSRNSFVNRSAATSMSAVFVKGDGGIGQDGLGMYAGGYVHANQIKKSAGSGNWDRAIRCGVGSPVSTGYGLCRIRDNVISDAAVFWQSDQVGATQFEGLPLVSSNQTKSVAATGLNSTTSSYVRETAPAFEIVTSGDISPSIRTTRANGSCATTALALADGTLGGQRKTVVAPKGPCTTNDTLTPAHFGDGTSLSWTSSTTSSPIWATLAWDSDDGTWRLIDYSSNVTINP